MSDGNLKEALSFPENLYWAWEKVRRFYYSMDGWYDELAIAQFEANLEQELRRIAKDFERGRYSMQAMRPLPQPKKRDSTGKPQTRQAFWVAVRDQVAWTAYMNVVGPRLDQMMPPWSYGNRLYRSVWYDDDEARAKLHIGRYRNSSGQIYRSFRHSWPLYRRHVHLTIRQMSAIGGDAELGSAEISVLEAEKQDLSPDQRLPYLVEGYWRRTSETPCWVSLDLEKFYPSVNLEVVRTRFREVFADEPDLVGALLDDLLRFRLDLSGFTDGDLEAIGLRTSEKAFPHIPTGLMGAGFLANVALLDVDRTVADVMRENQVAVFRYVDDHIILAPSFEELDAWVRLYKNILEWSDAGASFNAEKFEPREFGEYFAAMSDVQDIEARRAKALEKCRLDPRFPAPLMTQTLAKISDVTRCDVELLDDPGQEALLADLEHLMLTDFPKTELPPPTRVSFAAGKIARVAAERLRPVTEVVDAEQHVYELKRRLEASANDPRARAKISAELATAKREYFAALRRYQHTERRDCRRTFWLLIKAVHDYPEKLRLWQHVLNYCRLSGHRDLGPIFEELDRYTEANPLAGRFIRATILKVVTWQLVSSARLVAAPDSLPRRRRRALRYILAVLKQPSLGERRRDAYFYESTSEWTFLGAVGTVVVFLVDKYKEAGINPSVLGVLDTRRQELAAIDWLLPDDFVALSGHNLPIWAWWAEAKLQQSDAVVPGIIWELVSGRLPVNEPESWSFWKLYPGALPRIAQRAIQDGSYRIRPEERGWLLDVATDGPPVSRPARPSSRPMMDLVEWVDWVRKRSLCDEFDPRLGEWTCLEIARQITGLVQRRHALRSNLHPRNFLIPAQWFEGTECPTWEAWHNRVAENRVVAAKAGLIRDARIVPAWVDSAYFVWDADAIQGLALMLLGLLRRDFRWPAVWNPLGQQRAWARLAKRLIGSAACSSWTASILEGCLASRGRESLLMSIFALNSFGEDDTTSDPPEIGTLGRLEKAIAHSKRILEQYQLSVKNHAPRQLVPIRLDQMSRKTWGEVEGDTAP